MPRIVLLNNGLTLTKTLLNDFKTSKCLFRLLKIKHGKRINHDVYIHEDHCIYKTEAKEMKFDLETIEDWYQDYKEDILNFNYYTYRSDQHDNSIEDINMIQFCIMLMIDTPITRRILERDRG